MFQLRPEVAGQLRWTLATAAADGNKAGPASAELRRLVKVGVAGRAGQSVAYSFQMLTWLSNIIPI